jgi:hypothetical protein
LRELFSWNLVLSTTTKMSSNLFMPNSETFHKETL